MSVKQISVFLEHKPGTLYDMTMTLADNDIIIKALNVTQDDRQSVARLVVDNVLWTSSILKNAGYSIKIDDVVIVNISNVTGGLNRILEILNDAEINIEYMYSIMLIRNLKNTETCMIFEVDEFTRASNFLEKSGVKIIRHGELSEL